MKFYSFIIVFAYGILSSSCKEQKSAISHFVELDQSDIQINTINDSLIGVRLTFLIKNGFHIQPEKLSDTSNFIPTRFTLNDKIDTFKIIRQSFKYKAKNWSFDNESFFDVISESFDVVIKIKPMAIKMIQEDILHGELFYQACDDKKCYYPRTLTVEITL